MRKHEYVIIVLESKKAKLVADSFVLKEAGFLDEKGKTTLETRVKELDSAINELDY